MKEALRKSIKEKRNTIDNKTARSKIIIDTLKSTPQFQQAKNVLLYASYNSEVETHDLIKECLRTKNVFIPFVEKHEMFCTQITNFEDLTPGMFGILEPKHKMKSDQQLDLIIVPGVGFDSSKTRIGYGKGFYDSFLKTTNAVKIALAFDCQIADHIPHEAHDVAMDMIITESEVIQ